MASSVIYYSTEAQKNEIYLFYIIIKLAKIQPRSQGLRGETVTKTGKIRFIVPKFWENNRMRSETQPYSTVLQYGCVALRMRFFSQNFGTIK